MKMNWQTLVLGVVLTAPVSFAAQDDAALPLPPLEKVLKGVTEQGKKESEAERMFKQFYSYTRSKVTEYRNASGELKNREEKKRAYKPASAPAVSLPRSSDAKPQNAKPGSDAKFSVRDKAFDKSDFALGDDLLGRFDFSLAGRETVNGRPALLVDFKPADKSLPERSLKDKFINRAAGRVWVDEQDYAVVKADLRLIERVNVVGGLVGAVWKFTYGFVRERTEDGIWFARNVNWHLEGREVFVRRTIDYHEENTDVKKVW